ncbi:MAG: M28 family peptidase [Acidobacteria bacterium]|nr:M28 family peptidase [Acidobacteriota bacterium]
MSLNGIRVLRRLILSPSLVAGFVLAFGVAAPSAQTAPAPKTPPAPNLAAERALAATVSEQRMVETVRRLVGIGTRMYGTPSNHESAAWLAAAFKEAGLEVVIRQDTPRDWYQPVSWDIRALSDSTPAGRPAAAPLVLKTTWPNFGAPSGKGEGLLSVEAAPGAVCLVSSNPTPTTTSGCVAVLFDGRVSSSGWPNIGRSRGTWTIPVFVLSPREANPIRERVAAGEKVRITFALDAKSGNAPGETVVATLPGKDRTKYVLFCAHGDSDSGGPGADDNASGVATILEIARTAAAAIKAGRLAHPAWDIRFAAWGGEMSSTREYYAAMDRDASKLQAVFNYDQAGFGSTRNALYVEPDDVAVNTAVITLARAVMKDHLSTRGFPEHAASIKSQGGTDSYVFQNTRTPGATLYPSVTLYTSAWDKPNEVALTEGFPPLNWYPDEKPGKITVDGDPFYHSVGDTPANTTDTEPSDMGWCARVGLLSALRLMTGR